MKIPTYAAWFQEYFRNSYICAMSESGILKEDWLREGMSAEEIDAVIRKYQTINQNGVGIHFTPNAVKGLEGRHHIDNFLAVNAWYMDLDSPWKGPLQPLDPSEDFDADTEPCRAIWKMESSNKIKACPIMPTYSVVTRNGFHLFWVVDGHCWANDFLKVQTGLYDYFEENGCNPDPASKKLITLFRVPGMLNEKFGEKWMSKFVDWISSEKKYTPKEMLEAYPGLKPPPPEVYKPPALYKPDGESIFERVHQMPVEQVVERLSGSALVGGETFTLRRHSGGKGFNIDVDGKPTGNFIDTTQNHIYGKAGSIGSGPTITQWLRYYGHDYKTIAEEYKNLFS